MPRGNEWKGSETRLLKKLFNEDKSIDELVKAIGRTECAIRRKCRLLCLSFSGRNKANKQTAVNNKSTDPDARECLRCHEWFKSEWIGNRVCGCCRRTNSGYAGVVYD